MIVVDGKSYESAHEYLKTDGRNTMLITKPEPKQELKTDGYTSVKFNTPEGEEAIQLVREFAEITGRSIKDLVISATLKTYNLPDTKRKRLLEIAETRKKLDEEYDSLIGTA